MVSVTCLVAHSSVLFVVICGYGNMSIKSVNGNIDDELVLNVIECWPLLAAKWQSVIASSGI